MNISHISLKVLKKRLNIDLKLLYHWLSANQIILNDAKTETILFRHPTKKINYDLNCIDRNLNWKSQMSMLAKKLRRTNGIISKLRHQDKIYK